VRRGAKPDRLSADRVFSVDVEEDIMADMGRGQKWIEDEEYLCGFSEEMWGCSSVAWVPL
jgi:hypothetical protein